MVQNIGSKYIQKVVDTAKKSATDEIKTASKRAIEKTAEATGDLIGNKICDKITSISKKSAKDLHSKELSQLKLIMKYQKKDIYPPKKDNKLLMN